MDLRNQKYIILELIPTALTKDKGEIVQLSALKLDGLKLIDRFDYRLTEEKVPLSDFIEMCNYDKEKFTYLDTTDEILVQFRKWVENYPLLLMNRTYTLNFLADFSNVKESVFPYLQLAENEDVMQTMITKYHLEPSNYFVDLIYEALIQEIQ